MMNIVSAKYVLSSLLAASLLALTACGEAEVKKEDVEKIAMAELTTKVGKPSPQITCPSGLKAKVGTTLTCGMPIDGKVHDVNLKVTNVDNGTAHFDIEVADKARP